MGDEGVRITGLSGIAEADEGDLTFLAAARYLHHMAHTKASAVLVPADFADDKKTLIQVADPYRAFAVLLGDCEPEVRRHPQGIHPTAVIGRDVVLGTGVGVGAYAYVGDQSRVGDSAILYAGVYVGDHCSVGANTLIYPHVVIREWVTIGERCVIHAGAVIGSDGFGFAPLNGAHAKIPQVGTVGIGDDVEIGANTTIDRATCGATVIGSGTKIDNLVQIGHNVRVGDQCIVSGQSGVAGSATIGAHVTLAGQVGVSGHLEIGDGAIVAGRSGVTKSVPPGRIVSGFPAGDHEEEKRIRAAQRRLPGMLRRVRRLEEQISELRERLDGKTTDNR